MQNRYSRLSAWAYDLDKPIGHSFGDVEFLLARLAGCDGLILEPAVGTGRILIPLLQAGFAVEGFDASPDMLERCRANCRAHGVSPRLDLMRFADFAYDHAFAAIILPAGSFELIDDFAAAMAVLRRMHAHLQPGGRLIVDLDPVDMFFEAPAPLRSWPTQDGGTLSLRELATEIDHLRQRTRTPLLYEYLRDGKLIAREEEIFTLRWWGVGEFTLALQAAGFADVAVCGERIPGRPPQDGDSVLTFEARRP
ncbi:MAG TPA: class I SAM-dependent methyltransferase [Alphaproteobacteria bacterium]|nr:class I SAM-dependent methyltransferase [Alphaproteobacteria bacterium]